MISLVYPITALILSMGLLSCKLNETGSPPRALPSSQKSASMKSVCFGGSGGLSGLDATVFFPQPGLGQAINKVSISFWLKSRTTVPSGALVDLNTTTGSYFNLKWTGDRILEFRTRSSGNIENVTTFVQDPQRWHHVVIVLDAMAAIVEERKILYLDGSIAAQSQEPVEVNVDPGDLLQISRPAEYVSSSCFDDIHIWHRPLTKLEVSLLYNSGRPGPISGSLSDVSSSWTAEHRLDSRVLIDQRGTYNLNLLGDARIEGSLQDSLDDSSAGHDPLRPGTSESASESNSSSGSTDPFLGGNDGYGGEYGDSSGGTGSGGGLFP